MQPASVATAKRKGAHKQSIQAGTEIRDSQVSPAFPRAFSTSTILKACSQGTLRNPQRLSIKPLIAANYCEGGFWALVTCLVLRRQCQSPTDDGTGDQWRCKHYKKQLWQQAVTSHSKAISGMLNGIGSPWGPQGEWTGHGTTKSTSQRWGEEKWVT